MTLEECEKAHKEGTWLLWFRGFHGYELVKITHAGTHWRVHNMSGLEVFPGPGELSVATPNDMLKYGE